MPTDATAAPQGGGEAHGPVIDPTAFYTLPEAARLSGFGPDALRTRCDSGALPCRRPADGGWRKVSGADLLAFLSRSGVKAPEPAPPPKAKRRRGAAEREREALRRLGCM